MFERIREQVSSGDRVYCVRTRTDVDLEVCLQCGALRELRDPDDRAPFGLVRCAPGRSVLGVREDPFAPPHLIVRAAASQ